MRIINISDQTNIKILLYAGRINNLKGIHRIIEALPYLEDNYILLVCGDWTKERKYYFDMLTRSYKLMVRDRIYFTGFIQHDKLNQIYNITSCSLLIGKFYEAFSRFILESLVNDIPCIVRDAGGNKEQITTGVNGIVLPFDYKTHQLVKAIKEVTSQY